MCGISGFTGGLVDRGGENRVLRQMCALLRHRGPDDEGVYVDGHVALGMRRLSIIDMEHGQQPVTNEDGTLYLIFNGEIYNFREIKQRLEGLGHRFKTRSDTEVIVHAYEEYGRACVDHFNGMFAFAIWNSVHKSLFIARDRLGIKPLYYWTNGTEIVFGSELTSILVHPAVPREIDLHALDAFLTLEYIPAPLSIIENVRKLPPGHWLFFQEGDLQIKPYWDVERQEVPASEEACLQMLSNLIKDAVRLRLVSDVPLGAFLSGGLDSSSIVACMDGETPGGINTFSVGFQEQTYNELPFARAVAARFSTHHVEEILHPDIDDLVDTVIPILDEPIADFSIFSTFLVSKIARQRVKVVLSGDGGDEIFGGYDTYVANRIERRYYRHLPFHLRQKMLPFVLDRVPPTAAKKGLINKAKRFVEGGALPARWQHTRWMMFLSAAEKARLYHDDFFHALNGSAATHLIEQYFGRTQGWDPLAQQQYVDIKTYLADNILTKVDRMSMAVSLEARVPLLDHRIVEFALSLPSNLKIRRGTTKYILRRAMTGILPEAVLNKPKEGFSIPLKSWLRGPLRPLLEDVLSRDAITRRGYFRPDVVETWKNEHLQGQANHSHRLWTLIIFERWLQEKIGDGCR